MTNADKIRAMTGEEIAKELYEVSWSIAFATDRMATEEDWLGWLKQEVSE